jgi:hypothetical protein
MADHDLQTIRAAKDKLLASAANYEELAAKARAEAADYETAERVLLKLSGNKGNGSAALTDEAARGEGAPDGSDAGKPAGIPTVPAMIIEACTNAARGRLAGLEPSDVTEFIRQKYWPDVRGPDVASTMWRMWKDGRLAKPNESSPIYRLRQT